MTTRPETKTTAAKPEMNIRWGRVWWAWPISLVVAPALAALVAYPHGQPLESASSAQAVALSRTAINEMGDSVGIVADAQTVETRAAPTKSDTHPGLVPLVSNGNSAVGMIGALGEGVDWSRMEPEPIWSTF